MLRLLAFSLVVAVYLANTSMLFQVDDNMCLYNGTANVTCNKWRLFSLIMLENGDAAYDALANFKNFTHKVSDGCGTTNEFRIYAPGLMDDTTCTFYHMGQQEQSELIDNIPPYETFNPNAAEPANYFIRLLSNVTNCEGKKDANQGGLVYFFFDSDCSRLAHGKENITDLTENIMAAGYYVKYMWYSSLQADKDCFSNTFSACVANKTMCEIGYYASGKALDDAVTASTLPCTERPTSGGSHAWIIVVGVLGGLLGILLLFLVWFCVRRYERQRMAREIEKLKVNTDFTTFANQYGDLKKLAKLNKKDEWEIARTSLIVLDDEVLGRGAFGMVYKGILKGQIPLLHFHPTISLESQREGACDVAVKRLPPHCDDSSRLEAFHEISFMKNLGFHAHVLSLLGCVSDPIDPLIIVEFCSNGDLLRFLRTHKPDFDEEIEHSAEDLLPTVRLDVKNLLSIAWQISDGLDYMASRNFIHRDVAARNVLITGKLVAKVGDFGLCRHTDDAQYTAKGGRLPLKWMAPESLCQYEFSMKSDVWAFGVLLYELYTLGDTPYPTVQPNDLSKYLTDGNRLEKPLLCDDEIYKVMQMCWCAEAAQRPTFTEIREKLSPMLNVNDAAYGYVTMGQRTSTVGSARTGRASTVASTRQSADLHHELSKYIEFHHSTHLDDQANVKAEAHPIDSVAEYEESEPNPETAPKQELQHQYEEVPVSDEMDRIHRHSESRSHCSFEEINEVDPNPTTPPAYNPYDDESEEALNNSIASNKFEYVSDDFMEPPSTVDESIAVDRYEMVPEEFDEHAINASLRAGEETLEHDEELDDIERQAEHESVQHQMESDDENMIVEDNDSGKSDKSCRIPEIGHGVQFLEPTERKASGILVETGDIKLDGQHQVDDLISFTTHAEQELGTRLQPVEGVRHQQPIGFGVSTLNKEHVDQQVDRELATTNTGFSN